MSNHADNFAAFGFPQLVAEFGETVVYSPSAGSPVTFTAPFAETTGQHFERTENRLKLPRTAVVECPASISGSPITYDPLGTFSILGDVWRVDRFGARDEAQTTIYLRIAGDVRVDRVMK